MGFVKQIVRVLLVAASALVCGQSPVFAACPPPHIDEYAEVAYVYDGDTVRLKDGRHIRLIGINTPELAHESKQDPSASVTRDEPLAQEARQAALRLIGNSARIGLQFGEDREDRYHRRLAHVFLADGSSLEERQLEAGLAAVIAIPPNVARLACYLDAEKGARKRHVGMWNHPYYRPLPTHSVTRSVRGYHRVHGIVTHVGHSRKALWLDFDGGFSVRIPQKDLPYFKDYPPGQWLKREITVRGWITTYRGQALMTLRHPAQIEDDND